MNSKQLRIDSTSSKKKVLNKCHTRHIVNFVVSRTHQSGRYESPKSNTNADGAVERVDEPAPEAGAADTVA